MTITEARNHYRVLQTLLTDERAMRKRAPSEPWRSEAIREIDTALASLQALGQIVQAANEAGLLDGIYEQAPLLGDAPNQTTYGGRP